MTKQMRNGRFLVNGMLLVITSILVLLLCEGLLRIWLDPVNYLMPVLEHDDVLGVRIRPNSAGHDAWGFRNRAVPKQADIVAIGDSQTYGVSALADDSWPAQLERLMRRKVYNLALGGYSPLQYLSLLQDKALRLSPAIVLVGFYFGNDLAGAYNSVYFNDHWESFRPRDDGADDLHSARQITTFGAQRRSFGALRNWLAHHSILYRKVVFAVGDLFRFLELQKKTHNPALTVYQDRARGLKTGFRPMDRFVALNLDDSRVAEGMRICEQAIDQMQEICRGRHIRLIVVLIPTKETVFYPLLREVPDLKNRGTIDKLIQYERLAKDKLCSFLNTQSIPYIDALPALREALGRKQIYPSNADGHPNKYGYAAIAQAVANYLMAEQNRLPALEKNQATN